MFNLNDISNENNKDHKEKWPHTPDHAYEILIIGNYGSGKTNALLNLTKEQDNIDKIYLYTKNLNEPKYDYKGWICRNKTFKWFKSIYSA